MTYCTSLSKVDNSLSFLDDYVAMALSRGKSAYRPASQRVETVTGLFGGGGGGGGLLLCFN